MISIPQSTLVELAIFAVAIVVLIGLIIIDLLTRRSGRVSFLNGQFSEDSSRYKRFIENTTKGYFFYAHDRDGVFLYISPSITQVLGYSQKEFMTHYSEYLTDNVINEEVKHQTELTLSGKQKDSSYSVEIFHKNGTRRILEVTEYAIFNSSGKVDGIEGIAHDVTEQRKSQSEVRRLSHAIEQSPISVVVTDTEGNIEYANTKFLILNELKAGEAIGQKPNVLKWGKMSNDQNKELWQTIINGHEWKGEFENTTKNGNPFWEHVTISPIINEKGDITNFLVIEEDLTLQKEFEKKLVHQTNYDDVTGLPNRVMGLDRLAQAIKTAEREEHAVAVMSIDLDQFKYVNDTFGHVIGDKLLVEAAERLKTSVRQSDTVARLGGDEFMIILPVLEAITQVSVVAQKVLDAFTKPFFLDGKEFHITASIGVTTYPSDGATAEDLLRNADVAMYKAKEKARNTFCFYKAEMNEQASQRMRMEHHLRHAIENNELSLNFQPLIDIRNKRPIAVEALLRWNSEELGSVPPDKFIPLAEESSLINIIGKWVLEQACAQAKIWKQKMGSDFDVLLAVNISTRQLKNPNFADVVKDAITVNGIAPENLELEITETLLVEDAPETLELLQELNKMGVRLSIDDFGTGYSSLGYLKKFPINTLKIDRSFINDVISDEEDAELAKAIIAMAHTLGLRVVAEGVETKEQLEFLHKEGCDVAQGYYFSKPLTSKGLREFLCRYNKKV